MSIQNPEAEKQALRARPRGYNRKPVIGNGIFIISSSNRQERDM
jgi:hypothetical protein